MLPIVNKGSKFEKLKARYFNTRQIYYLTVHSNEISSFNLPKISYLTYFLLSSNLERLTTTYNLSLKYFFIKESNFNIHIK